jgi:capsular polysaccharide biosynthesis protein
MQLDIKQILNGLRKRWWIALIVMLSAGAVAYLYSNAQPRVYQARVMMVAKPVPPNNDLSETIKKTLPVYALELGSKNLWRQVIDDNMIQDVDVDALPGLIKVQALPDQNALVMTVDRASATTDANAGVVAAILADRISQAFVERQMADTQSLVGGNRVVWDITQLAEAPDKPYQPRPLLYAGAAALFGLVLGLLLAIALELLDTTLKTPAEVNQYLGVSTLGVIPRG